VVDKCYAEGKVIIFMARAEEGQPLKVVGFDFQIGVPEDVESELKLAFNSFGKVLDIPQVLIGDHEEMMQ
jgi:hypothetical protein